MFPSFRPQPRPSELQWKYVPIRCGQELDAWIAGPMVCVPVHWADSSKPCRRKLTEGKLDCSYCTAQMKLRLIGYQPLIDRRGRKVVVTVSETVAESMLQLGLGIDVKFSRTSGPRDPVRVRVLVGHETLRAPTYFQRIEFRASGGHDIRPWLIHLWQDPYLTAFYSELPQQGTTEQKAHSQTEQPRVDSSAESRTNQASEGGGALNGSGEAPAASDPAADPKPRPKRKR